MKLNLITTVKINYHLLFQAIPSQILVLQCKTAICSILLFLEFQGVTFCKVVMINLCRKVKIMFKSTFDAPSPERL